MSKEVNKLNNKKNNDSNIAKFSFYFRMLIILSGPILFLIDNAIYEINTDEEVFTTFFIIFIPLNIISLIVWLYFINFVSKSLYYLHNGLKASFGKYFGYFVAFLFIPIGIFIVQPIINEIYNKIQLESDNLSFDEN